MTTRPKIVAVAGMIGAGKSSLVEWLEKVFAMAPFFEPNDDNPYLEDFYGDMRRYALPSQLFFLIRRYEIQREMEASTVESSGSRALVLDRTIDEDAEVFAAHLHELGHLDDRDWQMYQSLYQTLRRELRPPDLLIYLRCPVKVLTRRIKRRGRSFEQSISPSYLRALEQLYERWFEAYDRSETLVVSTGEVDYLEDLFDRLALSKSIERSIGLKPRGEG